MPECVSLRVPMSGLLILHSALCNLHSEICSFPPPLAAYTLQSPLRFALSPFRVFAISRENRPAVAKARNGENANESDFSG
jgi:hypothetical protein